MIHIVNNDILRMKDKSPEDIAGQLIKMLRGFFIDAADNFTTNEATDYPRLLIQVDFSVYEYFASQLTLESKSIWFSISGGGMLLRVTKGIVALDDFYQEVKKIDENIRLRIPDKYLAAEPWKSA